MNELTAEELAGVANAVRGGGVWYPDFESDDLDKRDQALAMVEWLAKNLGQMPGHKKRRRDGMSAQRWKATCFDIVEAIRENDVTLLQRLVLELRRGK